MRMLCGIKCVVKNVASVSSADDVTRMIAKGECVRYVSHDALGVDGYECCDCVIGFNQFRTFVASTPPQLLAHRLCHRRLLAYMLSALIAR